MNSSLDAPPQALALPPPLSARFATTCWSVVSAAGGNSPQSAAALEQLCRAYWYPLYVYVRRSGYSVQDAQDLTQTFFADLLRKNSFRAADRERGKFRSFLLASLRHFLAHEWEKARAQKRGGGRPLIEWADQPADDDVQPGSTTAEAPEQLFDRAWALSVFERGLTRLREECAAQDKIQQFDQLKTYLTQEPAPGDYAAAATILGLSPNAVAVAVHRLRHRYAALVRELIGETVDQPGQVSEELHYLVSLICD